MIAESHSSYFSWGYVKEKLYTPSLLESVVELQHRYTKNFTDRPTNFFLRLDFFRVRRRALIKHGDINEVADLHLLSCPFRISNNMLEKALKIVKIV